jgi:lipopolysaccharide biosynthesis glycosyltransferase
MNKTLIYFTIGGDPKYVELLDLCLKTLHEQNPDLNNFADIMVMCDENYKQYIQNLKIDFLYITDSTKNPMQISMKKVEIFTFLEKHNNYQKVLYLDCDLIIMNSLKKLFEMELKDDVLYVVPEFEYNLNYYSFHSGSRIYTPEQHRFLQKNNIRGFNCGQFLFLNNPQMKQHFKNVLDMMKSNDDINFFYEQSFMNYYFNLSNKISYQLESFVRLRPSYLETNSSVVIYHFANASISFQNKLNLMKNLYCK